MNIPPLNSALDIVNHFAVDIARTPSEEQTEAVPPTPTQERSNTITVESETEDEMPTVKRIGRKKRGRPSKREKKEKKSGSTTSARITIPTITLGIQRKKRNESDTEDEEDCPDQAKIEETPYAVQYKQYKKNEAEIDGFVIPKVMIQGVLKKLPPPEREPRPEALPDNFYQARMFPEGIRSRFISFSTYDPAQRKTVNIMKYSLCEPGTIIKCCKNPRAKQDEFFITVIPDVSNPKVVDVAKTFKAHKDAAIKAGKAYTARQTEHCYTSQTWRGIKNHTSSTNLSALITIEEKVMEDLQQEYPEDIQATTEYNLYRNETRIRQADILNQ